MREVKFRGKRLDNGEWAYGYLVELFTEVGERYIIDACRHFDRDNYSLDAVEVDPQTVGEYTGLKDENGKEIYEGDILSSEYPVEGNKNCHPVVWGRGRWDVDHSINDCCKAWRGDLNGHHVSEEVIGNIYENPEPLK